MRVCRFTVWSAPYSLSGQIPEEGGSTIGHFASALSGQKFKPWSQSSNQAALYVQPCVQPAPAHNLANHACQLPFSSSSCSLLAAGTSTDAMVLGSSLRCCSHAPRAHTHGVTVKRECSSPSADVTMGGSCVQCLTAVLATDCSTNSRYVFTPVRCRFTLNMI